MNFINAINQRISRRSYLETPIAPEKQQLLEQEIGRINGESGLNIIFLTDGGEAFAGAKGYGLFHGVHSVLVLKGKRELAHLKEKVGYYGELLILTAQELGLGSCWVGGTFDKNAAVLGAAEDEEIVCVVPIGNVAGQSLKEKMIRGTIHRSTKSIEAMTRADRPLAEEEQIAMQLVQRAPTAKNTQKVVFSFNGEQITAGVPDDYPFDLVDLGICKLHFEMGMKSIFPQCHFPWGNGSVFQRS